MEQNPTNISSLESLLEESEGMKKCVNAMYFSYIKSINGDMSNISENSLTKWLEKTSVSDFPTCNRYHMSDATPWIVGSFGMKVFNTGSQFKSINNIKNNL